MGRLTINFPMSPMSSLPITIMTTWTKIILCLALITCCLEYPCSGSVSSSKPIPIQMARTDRGGPGRTNSRFLRTFPVALNYYPGFARRETFNELQSPHELINGNSPVFYIRLPPAPYILVPGLGYVSPHPYNSPMAMGMPSPVMAAGPGQMMDLSSEQSQKTVISLPLKFISNGRPAIIESPTKPSKVSESKESSLISGGKYSFNGRPTAVFVVRSPAQ